MVVVGVRGRSPNSPHNLHPPNRDIALEAWELVERPTRNDPEKKAPEVKQRLWIRRDSPKGAVQLTGNVPLRLPLCQALLRESQGNERDFVFSRSKRQEYAQLVWSKHENVPQDATEDDKPSGLLSRLYWLCPLCPSCAGWILSLSADPPDSPPSPRPPPSLPRFFSLSLALSRSLFSPSLLGSLVQL